MLALKIYIIYDKIKERIAGRSEGRENDEKLFSRNKKIKFPLLWNHPSFSLGRSDYDLAIREADSASLSRFYWIFSLSPTLPSAIIPSCKAKWSLGLLDDMGALPHVQSSLWLLSRLAFSRFIFWYVMCLCKTPAISSVLTSLLARFFFYRKLVTHFSKLVAFSF